MSAHASAQRQPISTMFPRRLEIFWARPWRTLLNRDGQMWQSPRTIQTRIGSIGGLSNDSRGVFCRHCFGGRDFVGRIGAAFGGKLNTEGIGLLLVMAASRR